MLFQYAYGAASYGSDVVYICKKEKAQSNCIHWPSGFKPDQETMERIHMLYIENDSDLRVYLASIHQLKALPDLIIIDDFPMYFKQHGDKKSVYLTMATIRETADYIVSIKDHKEYIDNKKTLGIIVCDDYNAETYSNLRTDHQNTLKPVDIYCRWFPIVLVIQGGKPFELTVYRSQFDQTHNGKLVYLLDSPDTLSFKALSFNNVEIMLV